MTDLRIKGYASRFGEVDLSGDIVRPGAFSASLLVRPAPRPMLYAHDTTEPVGVWDRLVEDEVGLFVEGRLQRGTPAADRIAALVESGAVTGLSIGYRTRRARARGSGGRELFDIDLWEVSVVAFPLLPSARITDVSTPTASTPDPIPSKQRTAA